MDKYSQIPRSKLRGIKFAAQQSCGVSDPRGIRQISVQARLLGSLLRGNERKYQFKKFKMIISTFFSYTITCGLPFLLKMEDHLSWSRSVISAIVSIFLIPVFYKLISEDFDKRCLLFSIILGIFYSTFLITGSYISVANRPKRCEIVIYWIVCLYICSLIIYRLFLFFDKRKSDICQGRTAYRTINVLDKATDFYKKHSFAVGYFLILICWMVVWFGAYPGFFCYDAGWEFNMVENGTVTQHHPLIHVFLLGKSIQILYSMTSNYDTAIAIYLICQMLAVDLLLSQGLLILKKHGLSDGYLFISQIYFAVFPTVAYLSQCSSKDGLFSSFFFVFLILLLYLEQCGKIRRSVQIVLGGVSLASMLLRNNCMYAMAVFVIVLCIFKEHISKKWKLLLKILTINIIITFSLTNYIFVQMGYAKAPVREMLSIPIQQMAMVYDTAPGSIEDPEREYLERLVAPEIWKNYDRQFSDNVRWAVDDRILKEEGLIKFIGCWLKIGIDNPKLYIKAFLYQTQCAWDPSTVIDVYKNFQNYSYSDTPRSYFAAWTESPGSMDSKIPWLYNIIWSVSREISFEKYPVVSMLFSIGFMDWVLLFTVGYALYRRKKPVYALWIMMVLLLMTYLLGPFVLPRYYLILFYAVPLMLYTLLCKSGKDPEYESTKL